MSTFKVGVEVIASVSNHPQADRLEALYLSEPTVVSFSATDIPGIAFFTGQTERHESDITQFIEQAEAAGAGVYLMAFVPRDELSGNRSQGGDAITLFSSHTSIRASVAAIVGAVHKVRLRCEEEASSAAVEPTPEEKVTLAFFKRRGGPFDAVTFAVISAALNGTLPVDGGVVNLATLVRNHAWPRMVTGSRQWATREMYLDAAHGFTYTDALHCALCEYFDVEITRDRLAPNRLAPMCILEVRTKDRSQAVKFSIRDGRTERLSPADAQAFHTFRVQLAFAPLGK